MSSTLDRLTEELANLPATDRAKLAVFLLDSLEPELGTESPEEIAAAWDLELERRVQSIRDGQEEGIPAAEVLRKLGKTAS